MGHPGATPHGADLDSREPDGKVHVVSGSVQNVLRHAAGPDHPEVLAGPLAPPRPEAGKLALERYTDEVMLAIAGLVPESYRGVYGRRP